jgi:hypothetical protein
MVFQATNWKGTNPRTRQKQMTDELSNAFNNKDFALLCERIALLSPSVDDLKRIDQCLSGIEAVNQWALEDFPEETPKS